LSGAVQFCNFLIGLTVFLDHPNLQDIFISSG
jgi:hypothetical protein